MGGTWSPAGAQKKGRGERGLDVSKICQAFETLGFSYKSPPICTFCRMKAREFTGSKSPRNRASQTNLRMVNYTQWGLLCVEKEGREGKKNGSVTCILAARGVFAVPVCSLHRAVCPWLKLPPTPAALPAKHHLLILTVPPLSTTAISVG